jgi:hypothetical protein
MNVSSWEKCEMGVGGISVISIASLHRLAVKERGLALVWELR